jgi:hypothetical protein
MSGTPRAGRNARILIDASSAGTGSASAVTSKNKWSIDQSANTIETTAFEDLSKSYVLDLPDGKGTVDGLWDSADNNIYNLIGSSVARKFYLYPDVVNNATTYFFCTAFFSTKSDGDVKGVVNFSLSFVCATPGQWAHP